MPTPGEAERIEIWAVSEGEKLPDTVDGALAALRKLDQVEGSAIYEGGEPGRFYVLSTVFLAKGTLDDYKRLLADDNVIVRMMGLVCMARKHPDAAKDVLKAHLSGQDRFQCYPSGCVGSQMMEGQIAWNLLHNRNYMNDFRPWRALLTEDELVALDLEILGTDALTLLHRDVSRDLKHRLTEAGEIDKNEWPGRLVLKRADLRRLQKKTPLLTLVKGLGRVTPNPRTRDILIDCMADPKADPAVRLAAASALTRDTDPHVFKALERERESLDRIDPKKWGTQLLETLRAKQELEQIVESLPNETHGLFGANPAPAQERLDWVRAAMPKVLANPHPLAIFAAFDLYDEFRCHPLGPDEAQQREREWGGAVAGVANRLSDFENIWDSFSNMAYLLELKIRDWAFDRRAAEGDIAIAPPQDYVPPLKQALGAEAYDRFLQQVRAHTQPHK